MTKLSNSQIKKMQAAAYNAKRSADLRLPMTPKEAAFVLRAVEGCETADGACTVIRKLLDELSDKTAETICHAALIMWPNEKANLREAINHISDERKALLAERQKLSKKCVTSVAMGAAIMAQALSNRLNKWGK